MTSTKHSRVVSDENHTRLPFFYAPSLPHQAVCLSSAPQNNPTQTSLSMCSLFSKKEIEDFILTVPYQYIW